jgi:hypothetical protein
MKQYLLAPVLCFFTLTQVYAAEPASVCALVSAADIQSAFGQAVEKTTDTGEFCDYENSGFSVRVTRINYHDEDAAKQGFKTLFSGKTVIKGLGDEANSLRRGREVEKVSMRQGQTVLSISRMGGEFKDDDLHKLESLLRQAAGSSPAADSSSAAQPDAACEPIIKASETKIAQPAWHSVTEGDGVRLEAIKVDGQFFMSEDGKWQKAPMDMDAAEKIVIGMMRDGSVRLSNCKEDGTETVEGVEMTVLSYHSEMEGMGSSTNKLYIGKADGLPYKTEADGTTNTVRYQDVTAPKL